MIISIIYIRFSEQVFRSMNVTLGGAYCCCSVTKSCQTLCDPMDCSTPGFPLPHHSRSLPKFMSTELGFLSGSSEVKASALNVGDPGLIPGLGRSPGEGNGNPLQYLFLPRESHGWRSLVGYSPRGCKELDMTERVHFTSLHFSEI